MKRYLILMVFVFSAVGMYAQKKEKIRGNKEVVVTQTTVEEFSTLEIGEEFKVTLVKGKEAIVEIETDENLQDVIQKDVISGTLYLTTTKDIRRSKKMRIRITFTDKMNKIIVKDDAEIEALTHLSVENLEIETKNNAEVYASVVSEIFNLKNNDKSKVELNLTAEDVVFQLNHNSSIEALVTAETFNADIYESATAKVEGDVKDFTLRADNSSKFIGEKLISQEAMVISEGRAESTVNVQKDIDITASGTSKLSIHGNPQFTITGFTDEAMLIKKR